VARETAPRSRFIRWITLGVLGFLLWTALAVAFATQLYFAGLPWSQALQWSIPRWYAWGLLTPFVFWIDRRLHGIPSPVARFLLHVPLGIAFTLLSIVLRLFARPLRGAPWPPDLAEFFLERFYSDLLIYAVIAGVSMSRDYAAQVRQRERQAADLALQAADLERRLVESRLQSLRAQLQPHFLFNALNTISAFTETDPQTARRLMGQLGDLLRASLTHANRPLVTLGEELTFLDDYLAIESARFEGRITVSVKADDEVLNVMVPSFLFQPLVENAIRHGVAPRVAGGRVEVTAVRNGSTVSLRVRDDGVGLPAGWQFDRDAGVGLRNVAARLEHLYGRANLLQVGPNGSRGVDADIELPVRPAATPAVSRQRVAAEA
jgi:two-component system, LytTR family, sensor kinase